MKVVPRKRSCVLWDGALVFLSVKKEGETMNLTTGMIPGLSVLLAGAFVAFFGENLCRKKENANQVRVLGVLLAFVGAILVFVP